jgi:uncharacterized protein YkwD
MQGRISGMTRKLLTSALLTALVALAGPAAADACKREGAEPAELSVKEARSAVFCLINERRRQNGVGKLRSDDRLDRAAQRHSKAMDGGNFFSHYGPGGSSPQGRIQSTGYMSGASSWGIAENIRWGRNGRGSPKAAVAAWMNSPSHRSSMLSGRYEHVGIGFVVGSPTGGGEGVTGIYTTTFGYRSG